MGLFHQMIGDQFGHLKHADRSLSVKHGLKGRVGIDLAFVLLVLQAILLDVIPELAGELGAGKRLSADDRCQLGIGGHGFHESRAGLALGGFLG